MRCHVGLREARDASWLPFDMERARGLETYRHVPALEGEHYTTCGLEAYLRAPVPRRAGAHESMFPTRAQLPGTAPCPPPRPDLVERGRALFATHCASCHANGPGPRLRLGVPLLAPAFFARRVREGGGGRMQFEWSSGRRKTRARMPAFRLGDDDVASLYAYTSADASDRPGMATPAEESRLFGLELYREVQARVFETSCRHCHSGDRGVIQKTFDADRVPAELPTRARVTRDSPELRRAFRELVPRLRARADEWSGRPGLVRGMPLTLAPLPADRIQLVERWVRMGCPTEAGSLCP